MRRICPLPVPSHGPHGPRSIAKKGRERARVPDGGGSRGAGAHACPQQDRFARSRKALRRGAGGTSRREYRHHSTAFHAKSNAPRQPREQAIGGLERYRRSPRRLPTGLEAASSRGNVDCRATVQTPCRVTRVVVSIVLRFVAILEDKADFGGIGKSKALRGSGFVHLYRRSTWRELRLQAQRTDAAPALQLPTGARPNDGGD